MDGATTDIFTVLETTPDYLDAGRSAAVKDIVRRWFTGTKTKSLDMLRSVMGDDIVIELPFSETGRIEEGGFRRYTGITAVVAFWQTAFKAESKSEGLLDAELTIGADGRIVFIEGRGNLTMADGKPYRNRYVVRMVIERGKIQHVREYYNPIVSAYAFCRPVAGSIMIPSL